VLTHESENRLDGRVVLLTGASQGIGAAAARLLSCRGAALVAHYRGAAERDDIDAVARDCNGPTHLVSGDYEDDDEVEQIWAQAVAWRGRVDVLVLNAAMMWPKGGVDDADADWNESWRRHYQVNVQAPARLMRAAVRHFRKRGGGVIVLLSSWVAQRGVSNPAMLPYAASKGAIKAVAQSIARGYADQNILTYTIAPGIVRTRMSIDFAALQGGEDAVSQTLAMKEWVPPGEVAELIAFLATGRVRHLSGATLDINGATYIR
jgi:NAD(P)-dependent dehydrogenase (short-subunit alcohol dehydrogenase family)